MQARHSSLTRNRSWWPVLILLPPLAAVLGGIATFYFLSRHPDVELQVDHVAPQSPEEQRHVTNSVVPPLH